MSVPVALNELPTVIAAYPWGYLLTVSDDLRAHSLAVPTVWRNGTLRASAGRSTRANIANRPQVTMLFPHPQPAQHSLIVDGTAEVVDDDVVFTPSTAVLHRPALAGP